MAGGSLEPLPVRPLSEPLGDQVKAPFPFKSFTSTPIEPAPEPEPPQVNRLEQLEKMLAEKHAFDESKEREAYDKAYASGEKAGLALGQKRAEQILEKMQLLQDQARQQLDGIRGEMCEAVLEISAALAEWVVGEITTEDRSRLLAMAERAARELPEVGETVMVVHPGDFSQFEKLLGESDFNPRLRTDSTVKPGCIRIANEEQDILIDPSASIAEAMTRLRRDLLAGDGDANPA